MTHYLATFVVNDISSDTDAINSAVSFLDFTPVIRARNMHVFLIRSEKTPAQLESIFSECLDPSDFAYVTDFPTTDSIDGVLAQAREWLREPR